MKIDSTFPFENFNCYKVFHKGMGRWQVCLHDPKSGKRRTILLSKFVLSCSLGRILGPDEQVDHKDQDKTNDVLSNLEIVTSRENNRRYRAANPKVMFSHICPMCGAAFQREKQRSYSFMLTGKTPNCSKRCGYKALRKDRNPLFPSANSSMDRAAAF